MRIHGVPIILLATLNKMDNVVVFSILTQIIENTFQVNLELTLTLTLI